ncbi:MULTISPECIES: hypothetical protein [Furfurilactobacillus]|jgi:hypothetical protein|nr:MULTISPECIES: hypothetical protein [Furfurilactobacillus]QLE61187.1 hypothetical protein LROSRS0_1141 [Furfurilactobacillus rossiae]QLE63929.1 hypothetical protein LROSL1_1111 [Furfurilactobacillus rossiae]QLE66679.1 hypothetical protein LROSL2_1329 [Furfurilactobacillus rossiae]QLE69109.1 hypothetical protein LROSL3_1330 [Furfurilactobacillus rossiae]
MVAVLILSIVLIGSGVWELMGRSSASHLSTNRTTAQPDHRQH